MKNLVLASVFALSSSLVALPALADHHNAAGAKTCDCGKECKENKDGKCEKCGCDKKECAEGANCSHEGHGEAPAKKKK